MTYLAVNNGSVWMECETRVQGKEDWVQLQGDWLIKSGEMKMALQALAEQEGSVTKDTPIEMRCRYAITPPSGEVVYTKYSDTLTFGSLEMEVESKEEVSEAEVSSQEESKAPESKADSAIAEKTEKSSFPWWIIILIILLLIIIIVIIVLLNRKKKDEENKG
ncbi:MAG: hypothetical protein IJ561_02990 [Ruminococcus sp.]|nr:hypothetical protein [Ruminococcus sp.]